MPTVDVPIAPLLGGLFLIAGAGKLIRIGRFRDALAGYRLARPRRALSVAIPAAELVLGAALVAGLTAAGWAAAALLAIFTAALGLELAAGTAPPACGCLPGAGGVPGPLSLLRNLLLAALAVAAALGVQPRLGAWFWIAGYLLLWAAVLLLSALVLALYRQVGVLHLRLGPRAAFEHEGESLPLGEPAPDGIAGRLIVFTSQSCPICSQIVPGLRALAGDHALEVQHARYEDDRGRELYEWFRVPGTPYAVFVDGNGLIRAKGTVNTLEQLEGLVVTGREREREQVAARAA